MIKVIHANPAGDSCIEAWMIEKQVVNQTKTYTVKNTTGI